MKKQERFVWGLAICFLLFAVGTILFAIHQSEVDAAYRRGREDQRKLSYHEHLKQEKSNHEAAHR